MNNNHVKIRNMFKKVLNKLQEISKRKGVIDDSLINFLDSIFSNNANNVLDVIKRGFKKYCFNPSNRELWTVKGNRPDMTYYIYPKVYCSCQDYYKNVVVKKKKHFCKHLLAQAIAEGLETFSFEILKDEDFLKFKKNIKLEF